MTPFSRVAVVGVGLIGGSLGMALRQRGLAMEVVGIGRRPEALARAIERGAIDEFATDFATGVAGADLIVLATPVAQILTDIERLAPLLTTGAVVTDVGSTKGEIVRAGEAFLSQAFVGSHPMAGSEKSGVDAGRADLFEGAVWAVTPTPRTPPENTAKIEALGAAVGSRIVTLAPDAHDNAVALTSHLPHVLAYALAALAGGRSQTEPRLFDLAAGSFASATRVAHSSPELWRDIALSNRPALIEAMHAYRTELDAALAAVESADADALLNAFTRGHSAVTRQERL